ncbi:MAG TPA: CocE/NonD family hydrolase [Vicinamibacterales bacterium]|nr:CocE/NonD family hydrolase [Vicinamibacterales bacterium]
MGISSRAILGPVALIMAAGVLVWAAAPAASRQQAAGEHPVVVEKNVEARMRDGVVLRADVYRPRTPGRFPVLLQRTPYSKSPGRVGQELQRQAARGYVVIAQDTRGRYTSDGEARPHDEASDPRFDRNPNTGGIFGEESELRRAHKTVLHDRSRPSRLILPIVPR